MKFIVSSLKLLKSLQALSGVIGSNNTLPILDDFLFQLSDTGLKITVSDLETTMTVGLQPDMKEGAGEVTIPARILLDIMKNFPDVPVTVSIDEDTLAVVLRAGEGQYKLSGHKSDEFPQVTSWKTPWLGRFLPMCSHAVLRRRCSPPVTMKSVPLCRAC